MAQRLRQQHISGNTIGLLSISGAGSVLTYMTDSPQAQNAILLLSTAALAAIIISCLTKAGKTIEAALRLAHDIARGKPESDSADPAQGSDSMATVIPLPEQRARRQS